MSSSKKKEARDFKPRPMSLLATKLYMPGPQAQLLSRPRLFSRLDEGIKCRILLLSAPAGFGKTQLLGDWLRQRDFPSAWISVDAGDRDPVHFLTYMIAALQKIKEGIGLTALNLLQAPSPPSMESILITLINSITPHKTDFVLVLDDLHLGDSPEFHDLMAFLIENMPVQMHLCIATRSDPPLPLARLRSQNQLAEIRASDLSFTWDETEVLLQQLGLPLREDDIKALESRTEGWIAGLQLAVLSMKGRSDLSDFVRSFAGENRFIVDYLGEEVLGRQTPKVQRFLYESSILDRMCAGLCDAVGGRSDGSQMLDFLEKSNLFIFPLDDERQWFRFHRLFLDLLRRRLKNLSPGLWPELHKRASAWFEKEGFLDEAITHAFEGEDHERAADLVMRRADSVWDRGQQHRLLDWLGRLPPSCIEARPRLDIYIARGLAMNGKLAEAEARLKVIVRSLEEAKGEGGTAQAETADLQGRAASIQAFLAAYQGRIEGMIKFSRTALDLLDQNNIMWRGAALSMLGLAHSWAGDGNVLLGEPVFREAVGMAQESGNIYFYLFSGNALAATESLKGNLNTALDMVDDLLSLAEKTGASDTGMAGAVLAVKGSLLSEFRGPEESLPLIEQGLRITGRSRDRMGFLGCLVNKLQALLNFGRFHEAQKTLDELKAAVKTFPAPPWMRQIMTAIQGKIWLALGNMDALKLWVLNNGLDAEDDLSFRREYIYLVLARYSISQGDHRKGEGLLKRMIDFSEAGGRGLYVMTYRFNLALSLAGRGERESALEEMRLALPVAERGGACRSVLSYGKEMRLLLEMLLEKDDAHPSLREGYTRRYIKRLLSLFRAGKSPDGRAGLPEPLSERETDVLRLISAGLTNQDIADKLFISLNTVRTHTKNINAKLGVHNRTQAVARAKELSLL
jgi:LuxR family maltose regulon positive regulatory protein